MTDNIFAYLSAAFAGQKPKEWHFGENFEVVPGPAPQDDPEKEAAFIELLEVTRLRYIESLPTLDEISPR